MPESDTIYKDTKLKFKGVYDLKLLYKKINEWLIDEGFEVQETFYIERIKPFGKIIEFEWQATQKEGEYFAYEITMRGFVIGANDVEVEQEGEKLKLTNSEIEFTFNANLIRNANKKWQDDSFIKKIYEEHFIKEEIEHQKIEVYKEVHDLMSEIKNFINLFHFE